ncbi:MAG TPA: hypothetical protein VHB50_22180, partial [Bryobacteraceae bacterium]|nr:hypothetical protein [Bryobacteraceae bacterium]
DLLVIRPQISSMPGHDAAVYLRTKIPGIPVLIVGGLPDDDRILNRETAERFEIFPRPFQASELLEKVKEVLAPRSSPVAGD